MRFIALAVLAVADELGDHRVVVRWYNSFGVLGGIDAHTITTRNVERRDSACARRELLRMLGVDAAFNRRGPESRPGQERSSSAFRPKRSSTAL